MGHALHGPPSRSLRAGVAAVSLAAEEAADEAGVNGGGRRLAARPAPAEKAAAPAVVACPGGAARLW